MRTHGLYSTYNHGCRCDECRAASTVYQRTRSVGRRRRRFLTGHPAEQDPMMWADHAACAQHPKAVFYPDGGGPGAYRAAKAICVECPVSVECLAYALRTGQTFGCWGGLSPEERDALLEASA